MLGRVGQESAERENGLSQADKLYVALSVSLKCRRVQTIWLKVSKTAGLCEMLGLTELAMSNALVLFLVFLPYPSLFLSMTRTQDLKRPCHLSYSTARPGHWEHH